MKAQLIASRRIALCPQAHYLKCEHRSGSFKDAVKKIYVQNGALLALSMHSVKWQHVACHTCVPCHAYRPQYLSLLCLRALISQCDCEFAIPRTFPWITLACPLAVPSYDIYLTILYHLAIPSLYAILLLLQHLIAPHCYTDLLHHLFSYMTSPYCFKILITSLHLLQYQGSIRGIPHFYSTVRKITIICRSSTTNGEWWLRNAVEYTFEEKIF